MQTNTVAALPENLEKIMRHGSEIDPHNRFERLRRETDLEHLEWDVEYMQQMRNRKTEYLTDSAKTIVVENNSPDIPFRYSVNPYRGCEHGCSYCYARNTHEFLGMNAGFDFETKILVKHDAPELFRNFLARDSWKPEPIIFSGVTDCYQPAERRFKLTRQCLEVAEECNQPISIITKNALVVRDLDILQRLAKKHLAHVNISLTTLEPELARVMEPKTSIPVARLRAIQILSDAGIPVRAMTAPLIPGLNAHEIPALLKAARDAGAIDARYILLRLPLTVEPVFKEWLERTQVLAANKIEGLIRQSRGGKMNDSTWNQRMIGTGEVADQIRSMFSVFRRKLGFEELPALDAAQFAPAKPKSGQMWLF